MSAECRSLLKSPKLFAAINKRPAERRLAGWRGDGAFRHGMYSYSNAINAMGR